MLAWLLLLLTALVCAANLSQYEVIPGHGSYRFSREPKTWYDARKACEKDGATLAVIDTYREAMALRAMFRRYPRSGHIAHVGFYDYDEEGNYQVLTGGTLDNLGYNVWKYPPNGSVINEAKDCGGMWTCGRLADVRCTELRPFFCEMVTQPPIPSVTLKDPSVEADVLNENVIS